MKHIVIVLHGHNSKVSKYDSVKAVIESTYDNATVLIPPLPLSTFSTGDPDAIVADVLTLIDRAWEAQLSSEGGEIPRVVIIGHSNGALLARKLYVVACGETERARFEPAYPEKLAPRPWAAYVDRVILFAGINRGWTINPHLYTKRAVLMRIGYVVGTIMTMFKLEPLVFKTKRGATFITQLRILWLMMQREAAVRKVGNATVIQLLGTRDDLISPEDNVDIVTGGNFIYLEVPDSDHTTVVKMDDEKSGGKRAAVFRAALTKTPDELRLMQTQPLDDHFLRVDEEVKDVVFVIHGIRDTGYWTQKVARRVKAMGDREGRKFATETSTYGYLAMLPFLLPFVRRRKIEWLMDQYTENLALYPNARFSFMGHSNGTYLLAGALKRYPACRFKHVVFAGSVVESKFNWPQMINSGRIDKFFNFVATADWVVAIFPKVFQVLRLQDLGSGGFDGFHEVESSYQLKYVRGGHGEVTREEYWDEIAHFIVHGESSEEINKLSHHGRPVFMRTIGALAPLPFVLILAALFLLGVLIFKLFSPVTATIVTALYVLVIWRVVTRI